MSIKKDKPYIFISYAHRDNDKVMPIIKALENFGYNVWYDGGITAGSEWPKMIAENLYGCSCIIAFVSKAFVESDNCLREITYAQNNKKPILSAFLDVDWNELPFGIDMQLGLCQSIMMKNFPNIEAFSKEICTAAFLTDSEVAPVKEESVIEMTNLDQPQVESRNDSAEKKPLVKPKRCKTINRILVFLELAYIYICIVALKSMPSNAGEIFIHVLKQMILPQAIIIFVSSMTLKMFVEKEHRTDIGVNCVLVFILVAIIGFFAGLFIMPTGLGFFLNLLISFLVNIVLSFCIVIAMAFCYWG